MGDNQRAIVLLHGWGGSFASTFVRNGWVDRLAELNRPIHGIDLPGHGGGGSHDPQAYADMAGLVAELLPSGRIDVIGYSLGGKLALALATCLSGRINRLVIGGVGDNLFAPEMHGEAVAQALVDGVGADTPASVASLVEYSRLSRSDPLALAAVLRRAPNPVVTERELAQVDAPVLVVNGDADTIAFPQDRLVSALHHCRSLVLPGVDHIGLPAASGFLDAAAAFVASE